MATRRRRPARGQSNKSNKAIIPSEPRKRKRRRRRSKSIADIKLNMQMITKNHGSITKSISIDNTGEILKNSSDCWISKGEVETIIITPKTLPFILDNVKDNQALLLSNIEYPEGQCITTKGNEYDDVISRTSEYFPFVSGSALILFDVDTGVEYNPENLDQVLSDITKFIPEFEGAAKVIRPSTSSNIRIKDVHDDS